MTKEDAQDYRKRTRQIIYQNLDDFMDKINEVAIRNLIMCEDYKKRSATQVARLHSTEEKKITNSVVRYICGKKAI